MEDKKELETLMARIDEANQQQAKFAKWQCIFSAVAALCCIAVLVTVVSLLPKLQTIAQQADAVIADVQQVSSQLAQADWEGLVADLEEVSRQLAQADLGGIAEDVSALVTSSQSGVEETLEKLNSIDLETLNKAIADLAAVVQPMAKLFGRF